MAETIYGKRIFTEINRPDRALVEKFRGIPSSNINDMMNRMFNMYGDLRCYTKGANLVGTALTVHVAEGDNALLHLAMDLAQPGDVIVLDGSGCMSRSLCGEIMFNYAKSKGIAGFVLDGCIRDADALDDLGFPVYAKGITPQGPWKIGYGEINVPIACCGQVVGCCSSIGAPKADTVPMKSSPPCVVSARRSLKAASTRSSSRRRSTPRAFRTRSRSQAS